MATAASPSLIPVRGGFSNRPDRFRALAALAGRTKGSVRTWFGLLLGQLPAVSFVLLENEGIGHPCDVVADHSR